GHSIKVVIIREDLRAERAAECDELAVNVALGRVEFGDLKSLGDLAQLVEHLETAATPAALHGIGRVSDQLELAQHKLWNHEPSVEKAGLDNLKDATIDNDRGVKQLRSDLAAERRPA